MPSIVAIRNIKAAASRAAGRDQAAAVGVNLLLRLGIAYFLADLLARPDDPRFARKQLPIQGLVGVTGLSLVFPALHFLAGMWRRYPFGLDNLYLSIFLVDRVGNSFDLYRRREYFDLLAHFHGPGALAVVLQAGLRLPVLSAIGLATIVHQLFEAGEYYADVFYDLRNVKGARDTVNDLLAGLAGVVVYSAAYALLKQRRRAA